MTAGCNPGQSAAFSLPDSGCPRDPLNRCRLNKSPGEAARPWRQQIVSRGGLEAGWCIGANVSCGYPGSTA
jgi:hypothetical protein